MNPVLIHSCSLIPELTLLIVLSHSPHLASLASHSSAVSKISNCALLALACSLNRASQGNGRISLASCDPLLLSNWKMQQVESLIEQEIRVYSQDNFYQLLTGILLLPNIKGFCQYINVV